MRAGPAWAVLLLALVGTAARAEATAEARIRAALARWLPGVQVEAVRPSPVKGLYEVVFNASVLYATADGRYVFSGALFDTRAGRDLAERSRAAQRLKMLDAVPADKMIIYAADRPRHQLTVFTDVDCPYCRRFHQEVPDLVRQGITVRYLLFPRGGLATPTYAKSVAVWCAPDRKRALDAAKRGEKLPTRACDNPVGEHYRLGERMGVSGTPTLITERGEKITGYVPLGQLVKMLDAHGS